MIKPVLILDLDGVLITTPIWKADEIASDNYSRFNESCVANLNILLSECSFELWLSSSRRTVKTIAEFNQIFRNRNIEKSISGFLPEYEDCKTRKDEIVKFMEESDFFDFLIIEDDKSLNGLEEKYKERLIITESHKGFDAEKLQLALKMVSKRT